MFSSDEAWGGKPPNDSAHEHTLSKRPGSFAQGPSLNWPPQNSDPVAGCTLVILVYTPLWTIELHKPCVCTHMCDVHTDPLHTDPVSWQPLLNPDFVYIAVNTDFYGFWFAYPPPTIPPPGVCLGACLLVKGRSEGSILYFLCSIVFLWQIPTGGKNTTLKWPPPPTG